MAGCVVTTFPPDQEPPGRLIQIAKDEKKDPTVTSKSAEPSPGAHPALPVEQADDAAVNKKYADNPDKPDPSTIAQIEVTDE
jgi:hypothetical protein